MFVNMRGKHMKKIDSFLIKNMLMEKIWENILQNN